MFEDLEHDHNSIRAQGSSDFAHPTPQNPGGGTGDGAFSPNNTSEYLAAAFDGTDAVTYDEQTSPSHHRPRHGSALFDQSFAYDESGNSDSVDPFEYTEDPFEAPVQPLESPSRALAVGSPMQTSDMYRYFDVARYRDAEKSRQRKMGLRATIVAVLVVLLTVAAAVGIYVSNINARLTANVTDDLLDQLVHSEPGDPFYLLLLGVDKDQGRVEDTENYGADEHAYRSDSIMLCRMDPKNVKITMVSIHRDTLVDLGNHGEQKINAAYAFGGAAYATKVVSKFAGVPISHYAEVDLDRFITIVDQVGGVTVDLPVPVYDPEYTQLDLPAGKQTLNGTQAALLCRCRHGYDEYGDGDRFRAANQRMVFSEVIKKVLRSDPATIASTVSTMADSVTTDMSVEYILDLAMQMQSLDVEKDISTGMEPTDGELINGVWYEICQVKSWQKMMKRVDKGLPPYDEDEGEYDSTAGIAGGVGEEGARAAQAAADADADSSEETETLEEEERAEE